MAHAIASGRERIHGEASVDQLVHEAGPNPPPHPPARSAAEPPPERVELAEEIYDDPHTSRGLTELQSQVTQAREQARRHRPRESP